MTLLGLQGAGAIVDTEIAEQEDGLRLWWESREEQAGEEVSKGP